MADVPNVCYLFARNELNNKNPCVQIIYILFNLESKKIIGVQQYCVALSYADANSNFELVEHEDYHTSGNFTPFENVIYSFDEYLRRTLHFQFPEKSIQFVTLDQHTLRQYIHPEAHFRKIELPSYYYSFYELRKEFINFYSAPNEIVSAASMLEYLQHTPEDSFIDLEVYHQEVRNAVDIIYRLINDGFTFTTPDVIKETVKAKVFSVGEIDCTDCVVRMRGLPFTVTERDISQFFCGLNIIDGGIALCILPSTARRSGDALVCFVNKEHRDMAVKRHLKYINNRYIEIIPTDHMAFLSITCTDSPAVTEFLQRGSAAVRLKGLPYDCTAKDIVMFFDSGEPSCKVASGDDGVLFIKSSSGRPTGDAMVLFYSEDNALKALKKNKKIIAKRYIEVFGMNFSELLQTLELYKSKKESNQHKNLSFQKFPNDQYSQNCIYLRGLPFSASTFDICDFLEEHSNSILQHGIHIVYDENRRSRGEAFIEMDSEDSALFAQKEKHLKFMELPNAPKRYIEIYQTSRFNALLFSTKSISSKLINAAPPVIPYPQIPLFPANAPFCIPPGFPNFHLKPQLPIDLPSQKEIPTSMSLLPAKGITHSANDDFFKSQAVSYLPVPLMMPNLPVRPSILPPHLSQPPPTQVPIHSQYTQLPPPILPPQPLVMFLNGVSPGQISPIQGSVSPMQNIQHHKNITNGGNNYFGCSFPFLMFPPPNCYSPLQSDYDENSYFGTKRSYDEAFTVKYGRC